MSYQTRNAKRAKAHFANTPEWQGRRDTERGPCIAPEWLKREAFSTVRALRAYCEINGRELDWCSHYGEPGYTDPERGILFSNWNDMPKALTKRLEAQGYELEWSDEWTVDSNNDKAYRTSPDSYGWQPSVQVTDDGELLTPDDDITEWLTWAENEDTRALPAWLARADIEAQGWQATELTYENGFHPGQTDNPRDIAKQLRAAGKEFLFQITDKGQFDVRFTVYTKE